MNTKEVSSTAVNTIKFNQTESSRSYEVVFSDNVGAGIVDVIRNMAESNSPFKLSAPKIFDQPANIDEREPEVEDTTAEEIEPEIPNISETLNSEYPHINDLENTLECSEGHWILIYAFYTSDYGKKSFTREDVFKEYKTKRNNGFNVSNFGKKWKKLFNGFIRTVRTNEIRITDNGIETVSGLISGKLQSEAAKPGQSKKVTNKKSDLLTAKKVAKTPAKTPAKSVQVEEFDLYKGVKKVSLEDFLKQGKVGDNTNHRILAIAYYIITFCKKDSFSEGNIEFAYKILKLSNRPIHLYQTIVNAKNKNLWFDKNDNGRWKLTRSGEVFFEEQLSK